jgi:hypothetical protein
MLLLPVEAAVGIAGNRAGPLALTLCGRMGHEFALQQEKETIRT